MDGYGSKIRKVSKCRPTVSNETILINKQEFFFTKVDHVQGITDIVHLGFWLILLSWIFFHPTPNYFFVKDFFFECLYFCEYNIRMFLFVFWLRNRPSIKCVRTWGNGGGVMQNVHCSVQGEGGWKIGHKILNGWHQANVVKYFWCIGSAKYTSAPARKMLLFFSVVITIIYPMR